MSGSGLWSAVGRLLLLSKPYWGRLSFAMLTFVLSVGASLALPLGIRELLDSVLQEASPALLNRLALLLLMILGAQVVLGFVGGYVLRWTGERVVADLRTRVYAHLHRLDLLYFSGQRVGDLTSRLTDDVSTVRRVVTDSVASLLMTLLKLGGSVAVMVVLNWRLALLILLVVPTALVASRSFSGPLQRLARRVQDLLAEANAMAQEALSSIRIVQAFARGPYEVSRYSDAVDNVFDAARRRVIAAALYGAIIDLAFIGTIVAIFWYGGSEVIAGRLSAGDLVAFLFYAFNIGQSVAGLAQTYAVFNAAIGASGRLFELLDTTPDVDDLPGAPALPPVRGMIDFDNVTFGYGRGEPVLQGVDFHVRPGENVAVVGPSGVGKTTLLNLILRFFDPLAGCVRIDGWDVRTVQLHSLREQIAVVTQDVHLYAGSILENIRYGRLTATDQEVKLAAEAANAHSFVSAMPEGYDTRIGERGIKLSGGQRQRIAIARAILKDAPILLLDEATSSLDVEAESLVQSALQRLMRERTTLIVAHRLSTIRDADRILVLKAGEIVEAGTHEELVGQEGVYARLVAYQFRSEKLVPVKTASSPNEELLASPPSALAGANPST